MGRRVSYDEGLEIIRQRKKERMEEFYSRVKKEYEEARLETYSEYFSWYESESKDCFEEAVRRFYSDYTPKIYRRKESMYDMWNSELYDNRLHIELDEYAMSGYRDGVQGENGLYDLTFRRGYHGGATDGEDHPDPGTPYWRAPPFKWLYWSREASFMETPPLVLYQMGISNINRDGQSVYENLKSKNLRKHDLVQ